MTAIYAVLFAYLVLYQLTQNLKHIKANLQSFNIFVSLDFPNLSELLILDFPSILEF